MKTLLFVIISLFYININAQLLLGPEAFDSDFIIHGSSASTTVWFGPDYYTPIDFNASGGCTGGYAGYQGSWNNYWMNFLRTPEVDCTGLDSVVLCFDLSNSYDASHTNNRVYFNMWIDGGYEDAIINQTVYFDQIRDCEYIEVVFDLTPYIDKSAILFYLNAISGYNDSHTFEVKFDNVTIKNYGQTPAACNPFAGNDTLICGLCMTTAAEMNDSNTTVTWSVLSTPSASANVTFQNINNPVTDICVDENGQYQLLLAGQGNACTGYDTISINFMEYPNIDAGPRDTVCGHWVCLQAQTAGYTGTWLDMSGVLWASTPNLTDTNHIEITNPTACAYYFNLNDSADFVWKECINSNFCCSYDTVTILFDEEFPAVHNVASSDTLQCGLITDYLNAQTPPVGLSGYWYDETNMTVFSPNANDLSAQAEVSSYGLHNFHWVVVGEFGVCEDTTEAIPVNFLEVPTSNAGIDFTACFSDTSMNASPSGFFDYWLPVQGVNIDNAYDSNTHIAVDSIGSYNMIWHSDNSICSSQDTVVVTFEICTGINTVGSNRNFKIITDNINNNLVIKSSYFQQKDIKIEIFSIDGRKFFSRYYNTFPVTIPMSKGLYLIVIRFDNLVQQKLVIF